MNPDQSIVIPVRLDEKTFRKFARFDMFARRKKWVRPAVFSLILIAFAFAALLLRKEQSGLIAAVLLVVGIGLPIVYFGTFLSQVSMQAVRARLQPARRVYTVTLREEGLRVENNQKKEDPLEMDWASVHRAYQRKGCTYLYVTENRAFLLPDGQANVTDAEVWEYLVRHLGSRSCQSSAVGSVRPAGAAPERRSTTAGG